MSRLFDGVDDSITFAAGAAATLQGGALSLVYAIRINENHRGGLYSATEAGTRRLGVNPFDNGDVFFNIAGQGFVSAGYVAFEDEWVILAFTKPVGSAQVRMHVYVYDTDTWSHTDIGLLGGNGSGTADQFVIGLFDSGQFLSANVGAAALWAGTALSNADVETLISGLQAWVDLSPSVLLDLHGNPATPIIDAMGSGADQTAIVGTTDAPGVDPPGFDYSFTPPPAPLSEGSASFTLYLAPVTSGVSPAVPTRRPGRLLARGRTTSLVATGGYVNA